ncbi:hypothetical protein DW352_15570 [Pseudolabrys taiwanensis]|uniref:Periplasmic heavy metal sensor n=1 Tax=Pseudolabrys taiwanensis TaxID=331696 RepID=A0A345ZY19_9HYPH|nr:periplasmic heavy metal sensor [Pseudolabrys taiwanensis]AXK81816.1 hypothetical protein DW352_15570 [Pseudolabrys taiwanensis]
MTMAQTLPMAERRSTRWLLLGSLALNLFFVGVAIAMLIRGPAPPPTWDRNVFVRVERIAATLPPADGDVLRGSIDNIRPALEAAQTEYRGSQDSIREAVRQEPFSVEKMRAAMTRTRTARQNFDQILQGAFADAAAKMSPSGRQALAAWPPGRNSTSKP